MSKNNFIVFIAMSVTIAFFVGFMIWLILRGNKVQKRRAWLKEHGKQIAATVLHRTSACGSPALSRQGGSRRPLFGARGWIARVPVIFLHVEGSRRGEKEVEWIKSCAFLTKKQQARRKIVKIEEWLLVSASKN
jgi:hypothetical protein